MSKINPKLMPFLVGDLFFTTNNTNPSTRFGGTWELYGKGKTIVGYDPDDTDFDTIGNTGGEKTHKLTVNEMPSHNHDFIDNNSNITNVIATFVSGGSWDAAQNSGYRRYESEYINYKGGDQPHNNMPPYITTYIWIKTA